MKRFGLMTVAAIAAALCVAPSAPASADAAITLASTSIGNVFPPGTARTVTVSTTASSVSWAAYEANGALAANGTTTASAGSATVTLPSSLAAGYYWLSVEAGGSTANTSVAIVDAGPAASSATVGQFGVATHYAWGRDTASRSIVQSAGASSVRDEVYWDSVEKTPGVYDWTAAHAYLDPIIASGIKPLLIADYGNHNYDGGLPPTSSTAQAAYSRYAAALVGEFGANISGVEIWNEWDNGTGYQTSQNPATDAASYVSLLKAASIAIRQVNPTIPIAGPADGFSNTGWLEQTFQLGALSYVDAVVIHPYNYPQVADGLAATISTVQSLVRHYNGGQDKPLWITEDGWPTGTATQAVNEVDQARNTAKALAIATAAGVARYYAYDLVDDGDDASNKEDNFGLTHSATGGLGAYVPKPAYAAFATAARELTGARPNSPVTAPTNVSVQRFIASDGGALQSIWSTDERAVSFTGVGGPAILTSLTGARRVVYPINGRLTLQTTPSPQYLWGGVSAPSADADALRVADTVTGTEPAATWTVQNTDSGAPHQYTISVAGRTATMTVAAGSTASTTLALPAWTTPATVPYTAQVQEDGTDYVTLNTTGRISPAVTLRGVHHIDASGAQSLELTVTNAGNTAAALDHVGYTLDGASGSLLAGTTLAAHSSATADVPLTASARQSWNATAYLTDGTTASASGTVIPVVSTSLTGVPKQTVTVDGSLDSAVTSRQAISLTNAPYTSAASGGTRPAGFGGAAWFSYDDTNLYLSARVDDQVQSQPATGGDIWQGDSLQFTVGTGGPGEQSSWDEIGAALTASGPQLYRWLDAASPARTSVDGAQIAVTRSGTSTVYEIAVPWASLGGPEPSDGLIASSVVVNDNDGASRLGWISWGGGIADTKNSSEFNALQLLPGGSSPSTPQAHPQQGQHTTGSQHERGRSHAH